MIPTLNFCYCFFYDSVKKLLTDALNKNRYLKRLEGQQLRDMVECMYEKTYQQGEYVIKQGEPGNHLFVLAGKKPQNSELLRCTIFNLIQFNFYL